MDKNETIDRIWDEYLMDFDGHPNVALAVTAALRAAYEAGARKEREEAKSKQ